MASVTVEGEFVRIVKRGLLAVAAVMPVLAGVTGAAHTAAASAASRTTMTAASHAISHAAAKAKPRKAGSGRATPHTVHLRRLLRTMKPQHTPSAVRALAPRLDVITPNGADIASEFDGTTEVSSGQVGTLNDAPEPSSATNGSQIVEVTKNYMQFFDYNGATLCGNATGVPLTTFLRTSDVLGPPQVVFDNVQDRFIFSVPVGSNSGTDSPALYVVVSNTIDPCGVWHWYRITFGSGPFSPGRTLDSVILGQDRNAALFEANVDSAGRQFQAYTIFAIDKADLYAGNSVSFPAFTVGSQAAPASNAGEPMIASPVSYFLGADPNIGYQLYAMTGSGTPNPSVTLQATMPALPASERGGAASGRRRPQPRPGSVHELAGF